MTPKTEKTTPEQSAKNKIEETRKALFDAAREYMLAESDYGLIKPESSFVQILDNIKTTMRQIIMLCDLAALNAVIDAQKEMKEQEDKESTK